MWALVFLSKLTQLTLSGYSDQVYTQVKVTYLTLFYSEPQQKTDSCFVLQGLAFFKIKQEAMELKLPAVLL